MHYNRVRATGNPGPAGRILEPGNQTCRQNDCTRPAKSKGLCNVHVRRARAEREAEEDPDRRTPSWFTMDQKLRRIGWDEVERVPGIGPCWEWRGSRDRQGYGRVSDTDRAMRFAHRIAYREWVGDLDAELHICHRCDNPTCINPDHLHQGSQADNMGEAFDRDRTAHGERQGRHKLTTAQVQEIRSKYVPRLYTQRMLADEYGISPSGIGLIVRGINWGRADGRRHRGNALRLSDEQVREVRSRASQGAPTRRLAGEYGVTGATIRNIVSGRSRSSVT